MDFTRLAERFPQSHRLLARDLEKVIAACVVFAGPETRFAFHPTGTVEFGKYLDFALSVYADKFLQLYEAVADSLLSEKYLIYAHAARSVLENAASLRYYARDQDIARLRDATAPSDEMINAALRKLDRLVRGTRFSWDAFVSGRYDELRGDPDFEELRQTNIQTCLTHWYRESPNVESLYALLSDMVHPNLGSALLVVRANDGSLVAGGVRGSTAAGHLVYPTLAGIIGAFKIIQRSFQELHASRPKRHVA